MTKTSAIKEDHLHHMVGHQKKIVESIDLLNLITESLLEMPEYYLEGE